jgi:hypothetical protein
MISLDRLHFPWNRGRRLRYGLDMMYLGLIPSEFQASLPGGLFDNVTLVWRRHFLEK